MHRAIPSFVLASTLALAAAAAPAAPYAARDVPLPGASADGVFMDYLAFDPATGFVWVPAGNTGSVDVIDTASTKVTRIAGFPTAEMERRGRKRVVGPSSATVGKGRVYVGDRADSSVCAVDAKTFVRGACGKLDSMPDGLAYVAATNEVWVTAPRDKTIRILDADTLAEKAKLAFDGEPEGFAVDGKRGRFYTNLEDADRTLAIDVRTHKTLATWKPACGAEGPHGLALDEAAGFLFIACSAKAEVMDVGHDGAVLSSIDTGDGVDNLDYAPASHLVYVGAAAAARLTVARVDAKGVLRAEATVATKPGARNGVVDAAGRVYLAHSQGSEIIVVAPAKSP
jgi:hypothetical protein